MGVSDDASVWWLLFGATGFPRLTDNLANNGVSIRCLRDTEPPDATVTDADGNLYTWVLIGAQYWLQQSLKTTHYNNGAPITTGLDDAAWAATEEGAWAYPNGDPSLPI